MFLPIQKSEWRGETGPRLAFLYHYTAKFFDNYSKNAYEFYNATTPAALLTHFRLLVYISMSSR